MNVLMHCCENFNVFLNRCAPLAKSREEGHANSLLLLRAQGAFHILRPEDLRCILSSMFDIRRGK